MEPSYHKIGDCVSYGKEYSHTEDEVYQVPPSPARMDMGTRVRNSRLPKE